MDADQHLLTDLALDLKDNRIRPVYEVATRDRRLPAGRGGVRDFHRVSGRDNMRQAIMMRLLTPMGELAGLGHRDYGSRLHTLVGQGNTDTTRNLIRLYILESLKKEPRVEKVERLTVSLVHRQPSLVSVILAVKPVARTANDSTTLDVGPFTLNLNGATINEL